jgi:glutamate carboxypeptidase
MRNASIGETTLPRVGGADSMRGDMRELEKLPRLLADLRRRRKEMLSTLAEFVRAESPTDSKTAVDRFGRIVAAEWRKRDAKVQVLREARAGNHLRVQWPASGVHDGQILVLGHLDTVYPQGTLREMPHRVVGNRAFGPGIFDMKGGLTIALFAVDALMRSGFQPVRRAVFLWNSDEETGSTSSRGLIEREARRSAAVLVLEPASGLDGRVKTERKGVGTVELIIRGRAAHAGINPEEGVNAVHELALQIQRMARLNDPKRGTTVSPTLIEGGTRDNVIPASARAVFDLRARRAVDMRALERRLRALRPVTSGAKIEIRGGFSRPPLERRSSAKLFAHAQELARTIGLSLDETSTGGGSDGSLTAALGVPTLDGLGAVGEGAHSANENIVVDALPERAALVAALLATL